MKISKSLVKRIDDWFGRDYKETFMERIYKILESEILFKEEPDALAYAHTLKHVLEGISVVIQEDEKIVGSVAQRIPSKEEEEYIKLVYKKWWDIPTEERHKKALFYYSEGWLKCRPYWFISFGHLAMDWERILGDGLLKMKENAEAAYREQEDQDSKDFLSGIIISFDAIMNYIDRYAKEAEKLGNTALAQDLSYISKYPAETFSQSLQLIWMVVLVLQKVSGCGVLNLSRMDQYLYPYYKADLEVGRLNENSALELLQEFYFKNNEIMVQTDHMSQELETTQFTLEVAYDDPNYLTLAGLKADGSSGVNELSYLCIEAAEDLKLRNPFIVVRYHKGIDEKFWRNVCQAMRENTTIVIYNDETMLPALKRFGVMEPEVYDYGFFGCNDPNIPAFEGGLRQVWFNMAKPLELALNRGDYPMEPRSTLDNEKPCQFGIDNRMTGLMTGAYYGIDTGDLDEVTTMEDFILLYKKQFNYLVSEFRKGFEMDMEIEKVCNKGRMRIEDCFLKGTVENVCTWTEGGSKYHKIVAQGTGIATVINSLYAIEKLVFIDKEMTLKEFALLLAKDFEGNESLSENLKHKYAKFGNDKEEVDKYAKLVTDIFVEAFEAYNGDQYLYQMWPTLSSDRDFTTMGLYVGATPDGRREKEPLSENQSPSEGTDILGITAMLNSVSKISFDSITGGPLNLRLHPSAVEGDEGLNVLCALFKTYMEKGGIQLQINVVDAKTLYAAQKDPEKYRNLCVRVTGYSAFFVEMGKKAQDELIRRTEQSN